MGWGRRSMRSAPGCGFIMYALVRMPIRFQSSRHLVRLFFLVKSSPRISESSMKRLSLRPRPIHHRPICARSGARCLRLRMAIAQAAGGPNHRLCWSHMRLNGDLVGRLRTRRRSNHVLPVDVTSVSVGRSMGAFVSGLGDHCYARPMYAALFASCGATGVPSCRGNLIGAAFGGRQVHHACAAWCRSFISSLRSHGPEPTVGAASGMNHGTGLWRRSSSEKAITAGGPNSWSTLCLESVVRRRALLGGAWCAQSVDITRDDDSRWERWRDQRSSTRKGAAPQTTAEAQTGRMADIAGRGRLPARIGELHHWHGSCSSMVDSLPELAAHIPASLRSAGSWPRQ